MRTAKSQHNEPNREVGFSLLELIVVLVILGLLAGVIGYKVIRGASEGKIQVARIQISELSTPLEVFRLHVGRYPTTDEGLHSLVEDPGIEGWDGPYLTKRIVPRDPWRREYHYLSPGQHGDYDIWSYGADGVEGGDKENIDVTSWSE